MKNQRKKKREQKGNHSKTGENNAILSNLYPLPYEIMPKGALLDCLQAGMIGHNTATY